MEPKGLGVLDHPLEPVIGLAEGETRWRMMTTAEVQRISNFKQHTQVSSPGLTGRSSIPETVRAYTRRHGVLAAPLEAGHDDRERGSAFPRRETPE
jgi:hypothetical protein